MRFLIALLIIAAVTLGLLYTFGGVKLGLLFENRSVETVVDAGAECYSACAIAFMGGSITGEEGLSMRSRTIVPGGKIGFHAPYLNLPNGDYKKVDVELAYQVAMQTVGDLISNASKLGIPTSFLPEILKTDANNLVRITQVDDAGKLDVAVAGIFSPKAVTRLMLRNFCLNNVGWQTSAKALPPPAPNPPRQTFATFVTQTGYFSRDKAPVTRAIVEYDEAAEGNHQYCVIDTGYVDNRLILSCRGTTIAENLSDAVRTAQGIEKDGRYDNGLDKCGRGIPINGLVGYGATLQEPDWLATLPAGTPLIEINKVLRTLVTQEQSILRSK